MMSEVNDSIRIKMIAERSFKRGVMLEATFAKGIKRIIKYYICPTDIPLVITTSFYERMPLYSVHKAFFAPQNMRNHLV